MFTGVGFKKAIEHYGRGGEVLVIDRNHEGKNGKGYDTFFLDELFESLNLTGLEFLVDVPETGIPGPDEDKEDSEPSGGTKAEKIRELMEQGKGIKEISDKIGVAYGTVGYYMTKIREEKRRQAEKASIQEAGKANADRHLCRTCKYRAKTKGCDYYIMTNKERVCDPEECDKYEEGPRKEE